MNRKLNPFHELYVTESIGPDSFVKLFSDVLVSHTEALFKPGNVVLKGLPGTGKSMMLSLLKPSIRLAYKRCGLDFPVPEKFNNFIGAGINLIRSSVSDFGQRPLSSGDSNDLNELAIYFGDFLNYWVIKDILNSVIELGKELDNEIDIDISPQKLELFTSLIKKDNVWFGYLDQVNSFSELVKCLKDRIVIYRSYLNYNIDLIPDSIISSKTAVGIPISVTAKYLRQAGVIGEDVHIFIRIDQYEELAWLDESINGLGEKYESVIHKLLAMRDTSVSYRIGTRPFAWSEEPQKILGTTAKLEPLRNYNTVSIDQVLRRPENIKTYIFPDFAEDIFRKRLIESNYYSEKATKSFLKEVFGVGIEPKEKALMYVKKSREKIIELDQDWPDAWKQFLRDLAQEDPLSARLGEAWARQKGKQNIVNEIPTIKPYPWEEKTWWKKERIEQALIQIASRNRQQLIWEGKDDIINLSGGNILAFLSLCQQIWEVWMRDSKNLYENGSLPKLDEVIQTLGILEASVKWYENISNEKGGGDRKLFTTYLGTKFYRTLTQDLKMSYPGQNGFSLVERDLKKYTYIDGFLKEASDYGDLQERPHTTKATSGEKRIKWYLNPILSPKFKIPAIHTKEPMYISVSDFQQWMLEANILDEEKVVTFSKRMKPKKKIKSDPSQGTINFNGE
jgi:hypothetical protein